jgi:hypothetical protein
MATKARIPGNAKLEYSAVAPVVVVVGVAGAALAATTVPVAALSGAIPSGTVLNFGGAKLATLSSPAAAGATSLTVSALPAALVSGDTVTYALWTKISELTSIDVPTETLEKLEASNLDSVNLRKENIGGWGDVADINAEGNWVGDASQTGLFPLFDSRTTVYWQITVPNRTTGDATGLMWNWAGMMTKCSNNNIDPKGIMKLMLTILCNSPSRGAAPAIP